LYPDLYNLAVSARACIDDDYAYQVLKKGLSYPYAEKESSCDISKIVNMNLLPYKGQRIFKLKQMTSLKYTIPQKRNKTFLSKRGIFQFYRTKDKLIVEKKFINFIYKKCSLHVPSKKYNISPFYCGLKDGLDIPTTIRYAYLKNSFIKEKISKNGTVGCAIVDFNDNKEDYPISKIFFDSQNFIVGAALSIPIDEKITRYSWLSFITFFQNKPKSFEEINIKLDGIDPVNMLESCVKLGINYSKEDYIFIFTDIDINPDIVNIIKKEKKKLRVFPLHIIPKKLIKDMRHFYASRA
jgi:hypothetical protein